MSCVQTGVCWPNTRSERACLPLSQSSYLRSSYPNASSTLKLQHHMSLLHFACHAYRAPKYKRSAPICAFGGKGNSESKNEAFSWDSLKKAMEGLKREPSMQDILRKQMKEQNFDGDGGGTSPPSGNGDGSGGQEDEGFAGIWDEVLQVVLATIAFIFVYFYMIRGEELTRLAKDYIWYLFGAKTSVRLRRAMYKWRKFYESITRKEVVREDWLERAIVATPTWWHKPRKLVRAMMSGELVPPKLPSP